MVILSLSILIQVITSAHSFFINIYFMTFSDFSILCVNFGKAEQWIQPAIESVYALGFISVLCQMIRQ
jgi:hypothetical protein